MCGKLTPIKNPYYYDMKILRLKPVENFEIVYNIELEGGLLRCMTCGKMF